MFEDFARQWTPVLPAKDVGNSPRSIRVAGVDLVLFRDGAGKPGALLDRCPHRGVSLALGRRTSNGNLACGFHGWEFDADGQCRHIPFNPDAALARFGATALPVTEVGGLVWVYTGFEPVGEPQPASTLTRTDLTRFEHWEEWDCHWTRAMENMLDFPHLPYVHRSTIGRFVRSKQRRDSRLSLAVADTDYGWSLTSRVDEHPPSAGLAWYRPNGMVLDTAPEPRVMRIHVWCVPVDARRTRMILVTTRNFASLPGMSLPMDRLNLLILHQDRAIVESSDPPEVPDQPRRERSVPTDNPTLRFRSWYLRELKGSTVADPRLPD